MNAKIAFLHARYLCLLEIFASVLLLAIRLFWGWQFMQTGWGKLTHLNRTASFFADLNIPFSALNAAIAGSTECFGGFLLLMGFASRYITVPLAFTMIVAYATAEREALAAFFSEPDKFMAAEPFLFLFASLIVLAFGPGKVSLDHLLARHWKKCPAMSGKAVATTA